MAFNLIGLDANLALQTVDTLLGTDFTSVSVPSVSRAAIYNTETEAAGSITVEANSQMDLDAFVSNTTESLSSGLYGASGMGAGAVLAGNRVSTRAEASIDADYALARLIDAGNGVTVTPMISRL